MDIPYKAHNLLFESNHISFSNQLHYDLGWGAAGIKNNFGNNNTFRGNIIHDNYAKGIWLDMGCSNNIIEGNIIFSNISSGITVEISNHNIVRNNVVGDNSIVRIYDQAQLYLQSCGHNEVYGNRVQAATTLGHGILIDLGDRRQTYDAGLKDAYSHENRVHNNTITYLNDVSGSGVTSYLLGWDSNLFEANTYHFRSTEKLARFFWQQKMTFEEFQKHGQEKHGKVIPTATPIRWNDFHVCKPAVWRGAASGAQTSPGR
jgi:parallel beta-helix repeat protein